MKDYRLLLTVLALHVPWLFAEVFAQQALDLKTALRYTVEHHASVKKANLEVQKGQELIRESMSSGLPQVNATAGLTSNLKLPVSLVPAEFFGGAPGEFAEIKFGTNWTANAGLQLEQMVFNKTWLLAVKGSYAVNDFYKLVLDKTKEEVVYEVTKLYYQVQLSKTTRGILQANLDQIRGLLTVTSKQFANGFAKKIDVDRLKVQESNLLTQLQNLDLQIEQAEQALKFAMNMPLETEILLTDTISENSAQMVDLSSVSPSYQNKYDLLILKKQQELYELDEQRYKAGYFPVFSFFGNYNFQWQANKFNEFTDGKLWNDFSAIGLRINAPIFDGFWKNSRMQTSRLNAMQVQQDYNYALLGLQLRHQTALSSIQLNQNNLRNVQETRKVAEEVYRIAQSRFKEGVAPITELLDAESSMRQAQTNYVTTLAQIKLAEIELLNTNGQLLKLATE